jgi:pantothenate kinase type III
VALSTLNADENKKKGLSVVDFGRSLCIDICIETERYDPGLIAPENPRYLMLEL